VLAIDPAEAFVAFARRQLSDPRIRVQVGDALHLPAGASALDIAVCGLVLNFIPEPAAALRALRGALLPGGTVALYVWDYAGKMEMLRYFWDSVTALDPAARDLDEGLRFPICQPEALAQVCAEAGLGDVKVTGIEEVMVFSDFADYWSPFLGGSGPAPGYVAGLDAARRAALEAHVRDRLPTRQDGSIHLAARAWAVQGTT
jgi:SAM-dependent methyltransferase